MSDQALSLQPYLGHQPLCAVAALTPPDRAFMHAYYDVCPASPSGRYACCLRLRFEDRLNTPADKAQLCVIDLRERRMCVVWETAAWGFQTGAHQAWGNTDRFLYFNDFDGARPVGRRLEAKTGQSRSFDGPIWQVSPDESLAVSPCLNRANLTQGGYGVPVRPDGQLRNTVQAADDDGLFRVDLATGRQRLLVSLADVWAVMPDRQDLDKAVLYAFHAKFNPQGTRILLVVRARFDDGRFVASLLVCRPDGSDLRIIVPHRLWRRGGHHPIWCPDGRRVLMNLTPTDAGMRFCLVDADTGKLDVLTDDPPGSGHPSISPDGRFLLTDETHDSAGRRSVAIRLVDLVAGAGAGRAAEESALGAVAAESAARRAGDHGRLVWRDLCRIESPAPAVGELRVDAHPVWDRSGRRIFFCAAPAGRRQLFLADPSLPPGEMPAF